MTDARLIAQKDRAAALFLELPGVVGVGIGNRRRDGLGTGELVLKVYVERKRTPEELTPGALLPPAFEGLGVDVTSLGPDQNVAPPPVERGVPGGSLIVPETQTDGNPYDPLIGGGRIQSRVTGSGFGTGGSFWTLAGQDKNAGYLLTNWHAIEALSGNDFAEKNKTRIGHPDISGARTPCCSELIGTIIAGDDDVDRDAALIRLDTGQDWLPEVVKIGAIKGTHDIDPVNDLIKLPHGYPVRKYGTRTKLTGGVIDSIQVVAATVNKRTKKQVIRQNAMIIIPNPVAGNKDKPICFSLEGDSGAAIVDADNKIVGIEFASSVQNPAVRITRALPIKDIIAVFNQIEHVSIEVATAAKEGDKRTVPGHTLAPSRPGALARLDADLAASTAGRRLRDLWAGHREELLDLVEHRRRVTIAWHRGGGPAMLHTLLRMTADPAYAMPDSINGAPPLDRLHQIHAVFHAHASPELRRALDRAVAALPDPAGLTYRQLVSMLGEG